MRKDLHPEVVDGALANPLGQIGIRILNKAADNQDGQEQKRRHQQSVTISLGNVDIDRNFREIRPDCLHCAHEYAENNSGHNVPAVGAEVLQQPPHEACVVCFTEYFFFVHKSMQNGKFRHQKPITRPFSVIW